MAINLQKGQTINLRKEENDLSRVTIGLGWDVRKKNTGFLGKVFGGKEEDYDLDAIALLLDENDKVTNLGGEYALQNGQKIILIKSDVIYFHNLTAPSGNLGAYEKLLKSEIQRKVNNFLDSGEYIVHTGDNLTGEGEGDDEQIIVILDKIPDRIQKVLFLVCIYQGIQKQQNFGMIENAFIRAVDKKGKEIAKYNLSGDSSYNNKRSLIFAELYRKDGGWKFRAIGEPLETDNFLEILTKYINLK